MRKLAFAIIVAAMLLHGAVGFRTDINTCDTEFTLSEQKANCYRDAALTLAAQMKTDEARMACQKIDTLGDLSEDYRSTQADLCYYDVAKLSGNEQICNEIHATAQGSVITGSAATTEMCKLQVGRINTAYNYKCGIIFVFPLILAGALILRSRK